MFLIVLNFCSNKQKKQFTSAFSFILVFHYEHRTIDNMHLETTQTTADNDEQSSVSFSDLYNLYEIIGKYVNL